MNVTDRLAQLVRGGADQHTFARYVYAATIMALHELRDGDTDRACAVLDILRDRAVTAWVETKE